MKLSLARTIQRLGAIHRAKVDGRLVFPIQVDRVGDGTPADGEFVD